MSDDPLDPPDLSPSGSGSREISAAAEHAREQLREEFEQLRVEIEELDAEESSGDGPPLGAGFRGRARASLAVLALTAAVAAAAANFALNGGRTPNAGSVSVPPTSREPEPGVITADWGSAETTFPLLSLIAPGLQTDTLGSNAGLPSAAPPFTGPSSLFVVGEPVPVSVHGSPGEGVAGANPVGWSPTPTQTQPVPAPDAPQQFAYSPPPAPGGGPGGGGNPGDDPGDGTPGDHTGDGEGPGNGPDGGGKGPGGGGKPGKGYGHIKANGKGHGGSPGKGHEMDQSGGEVAESGYDDNGSPEADPGGHGHGHGRGGSHGGGPPPATATPGDDSGGHGHGHGESQGGAPPAATATPAEPGPPVGGPGSGSNDNPGKSEDRGAGQGKSGTPGQSAK